MINEYDRKKRCPVLTKYVIEGGYKLRGEVTISGAKNAAVAIIPAALLVDGTCRIENIPEIRDVTLMLDLLRDIGADVRLINRNCVEINATKIRTTRADYDMARKIRASYYLIGALLGRFGSAQVALPGGCNFGDRPIDQHTKAFKLLGAAVDVQNGYVIAESHGRLTASSIYFDVVSVGATMNAMLAAVLADGTTIIENAAKEPHIVDLANFLNSMGANVSGAGTDVIKVRGVKKMEGGAYTIIPDQIEAGTYMAAVAAAGGEVLVRNIIPKHLDCITSKLLEMGVEVTEHDDSLLIKRIKPLSNTNIKTLPYPGFPTDMQPQATVILTLANGMSIVTEGVWDSRYQYVEELRRMGAKIQVDGKTAVVEGVDSLTGAPVRACDLRAGAALVIAGLAANGITEVEDILHIERGYEHIVEKLTALGAHIRIVEDNIPVAKAQ